MWHRIGNLAESLAILVFLQAAAPQPAPPPEQLQTGQRVFSAQCGFCHGRDAMGGETGPDLTRSALTRDDTRGDKLGPVIRDGRVDKGMPAFHLSDPDLTAVIAFIHDQKTKAASLVGARRTVDVADLQTGNADAGRRYFDAAGRCASCHSPTGDLAGISNRLKGLDLLRRMLYPSNGRGATVTVTLPSGETVAGDLVYRDEFTIGLTDKSGWYRSWPTRLVKFTVNNPLDAHAEQLGKYTDDDMHDVLAYLQTLR